MLSTANAQVSCQQIFISVPTEYKPTLDHIEIIDVDDHEWVAFPYDATGKQLGQFSYTLSSDRHIMKVGYIKVINEARQRGISEKMFEAILKEVPEINQLETSLEQSNAEIISQYLTAGYPLTEAVKMTPAFKMRAKFGFTHIIKVEPNGKDDFGNDRFSLSVSR